MASNASWRALYPFASHFLTVGEARMHYVDEGQGSPVLMVHGNPTWSFYWRRLIERFRGDYRVLAVDHIGCGLSDKPQKYPYTLQRHIDNLVALIDQLDLHDTTLVAHDWGGAIGLGAAVARADRFRAFVLLNTGAFPPPFIPWRIRICRTPWLGSWCIRQLNLFARAALWMAVAKPQRLSRDVRAGLLAPYDSWAHRVAIDRFVQDIPATSGHPTWQTLAQIEQALAGFSERPCQLFWGMQDWCFRPVCLDRFLQIFPGAEAHRLADASHYVVEDAYEQIIPHLERFLSSLAPLPATALRPTLPPGT
ncbi:MAG: alpha/beta fold hydrolase [Pirellulaceae bacterium]